MILEAGAIVSGLVIGLPAIILQHRPYGERSEEHTSELQSPA